GLPRRLGRALVIFVVGGLAWLVAIRFLWWSPFQTRITDSWYAHDIFIVSLVLVLANLFRPDVPGQARGRQLAWVANCVGLLVLAWVSGRVRPLDSAASHHWGVHVGPAELLRQGGWLLWDVPIQYGFLNTLLVAWLPTENVWQSFYLVNSLLHF